MEKTPKVNVFSAALGLFSKGYDFISQKSRSVNADVFETKIFFQKVMFMRGEPAARIFYDKSKFTRKKSSPDFVKKTLFGMGGVQGLEGKEHLHRKTMFMSFMTDGNIQKLVYWVEKEFQYRLNRWEKAEQVNLFEELNLLIFRAVCNWAGVPFREGSEFDKTEDVTAMIEGAGTLGWRHWKGRMGRTRTENWIEDLVEMVRNEKLITPEGSVMNSISTHRDLKGKLLPKSVAAVEIINIIRPTVAVGRFLTFAALALHSYPEYKSRIRKGEVSVAHFAQEVRRYYPFFPFVPAIVKEQFEWRGFVFPAKTKVFLDLYGTNHHEGSWESPYEFKPERFIDRNENPFDFIPQGGGDYFKNHRCPGEMITLAIMEFGIDFILNKMSYDVPDQDLSYDINRFPSKPNSGFVIKNVKRAT